MDVLQSDYFCGRWIRDEPRSTVARLDRRLRHFFGFVQLVRDRTLFAFNCLLDSRSTSTGWEGIQERCVHAVLQRGLRQCQLLGVYSSSTYA